MTWEPLNLAALPDSDPPEPDLSGVGYRGGKRHLLIGPPESLKTWAAFAIGLDEIRRGGVVLHVDLEMSPVETRRRLVEMGAASDELASWAYVDPERPPAEGELDTLIENHEPTLALIDASAGAFDLLDLDDNARRDAETFARKLIAPFHRAGVSTFTIDHVTKAADARGRWAIGSERKTGQADVVLGAKTIAPLSRGHTGRLAINTLKDRFGALPRPRAAELELVSDGSHITWTFGAASPADDAEDTWKPTVLMERVVEFLERQREPVTRGAVKSAITGRGEWVLVAIDALLEEGRVTETVGSRGAKLLSFRVPDAFPPIPGNESTNPFPVPPLYRGEREQVTETGGGSEDAPARDTPQASLGRISSQRGASEPGAGEAFTPQPFWGERQRGGSRPEGADSDTPQVPPRKKVQRGEPRRGRFERIPRNLFAGVRKCVPAPKSSRRRPRPPGNGFRGFLARLLHELSEDARRLGSRDGGHRSARP